MSDRDVGLPDPLRRSLRDLVAESQALRTDMQAAETARVQIEAARDAARRRESMIMFAAIALLTAFVVAVLVVAWQNQSIGRQNNEISEQIADCTNAGGGCYEEGRRRTGEAVSNIVRGNVYVHECLKVTDTDAELEKCVAAKLANK